MIFVNIKSAELKLEGRNQYDKQKVVISFIRKNSHLSFKRTYKYG